MSLWSRVRSAFAGETKAVDISAEIWAAINGGWGLPTKSGEQVSSATALANTAFFRGCVLIAEGVAQVPGEIYRPVDGGRGDAPFKEHPLYFVLRHKANGAQDAFQFWRTTLMQAVATGNGYAYKNVVNGVVRELIPIRPECVQVDLDRFYRRKYTVTFEQNDFAVLDEDAIFHLRGPSWHLHKGLDPTVIGREAIGLAQATESTHASLHRNGVRPSGTLNIPAGQKITQDQIDRLRAQWVEAFSGSSNTGKVPVLTGGMDFKALRQTGVDAEHLETRKHQIGEISRLLGLFPIMLGHSGDSNPTFASAGEFMSAHVRHSLQPWRAAVQSAVHMQLLTPDELMAGVEYRIDFSELTRGSIKERTEYYKAALGTNSNPGWLTPNEVRQDDGWNPDEDSKMDQVWQPATMAPGGQAEDAPADQQRTEQ